MNKTLKIIIALVLIIGSLVAAQLKISTTWHYFGNGALFGIGISMLFRMLFCKSKQ